MKFILNPGKARAKAIEALKNEPHKAYNYFCQAIKITPEINEAARLLCLEMGFQVRDGNHTGNS